MNTVANKTSEENHENLDDLIVDDDNELLHDNAVGEQFIKSIVSYSRDWTVETVLSQITKDNIELYPSFQRRNAWDNDKKSRLIESYLMGYPVPEIVLAEYPKGSRKFIVIDGKQRLLTLYSFTHPTESEYTYFWQNAKLTHLKNMSFLNGKTYAELTTEQLRQFHNADVRCSVIADASTANTQNGNSTDNSTIDFLYDIFYRLNAGAKPLSTQELRQVLYCGEFTKYIDSYTMQPLNIHKVLKVKPPHNGFKDSELLLRNLALHINGAQYSGNLKVFLDEFTKSMNDNWDEEYIDGELVKIEEAIEILKDILDGYENIGRRCRKKDDSTYEFYGKFNTVLFEVQIYFIICSEKSWLNHDALKKQFKQNFASLCEKAEFKNTLGSSTSGLKHYMTRFAEYQRFFQESTNENINSPWLK